LLGGPLPDGVDAIVPEHDAAGLVKTIQQAIPTV
jgi:hypothetical protein